MVSLYTGNPSAEGKGWRDDGWCQTAEAELLLASEIKNIIRYASVYTSVSSCVSGDSSP